MFELISSIFGIMGFLALVFLPGGWVTFTLPLSTWPFWARLSLGAVLAPLVVCLQFYAVRLLGASFEHTVPLLIVLNLPVLFLIWRQRENAEATEFATMIHWGVVLLVPLVCLLGPLFLFPTWRMFWGHPWMHADIIYTFANGALIPEEVELAGITLSYPWAGHIYQAVLSFLLGSTPVSSFRWTNLLWLVFVIQLMTVLVAMLGGRRFAAVSSVVLLLFGVNFVGYTLAHTLPDNIVNLKDIWGDYRYTPWVLKFASFHQMTFALGLFIGTMVVMAEKWPAERAWDRALLVFLLLSGLGVIYPVLLPPAYAVVFAGALSLLVFRYREEHSLPYGQLIALGVAIVLATAVIITYLGLVTQDSSKATMIRITTLRGMTRKSIEALIATLPLLAGLGVVFFRCWNQRRHATFVLLAGALASIILYVVFYIPYFTNEYKFVFTAAICLSPFAGLALEPVQERLGRSALPITFLLTCVLAGPFLHKVYIDPRIKSTDRFPALNTRSFDLRLNGKERFSLLSDTIREKTPLETILVTDQTELHLPTVTRRKFFAPPEQVGVRPGVFVKSELLLGDIRGYDRGLIRERRLVLKRLFDENEARRSEPLARILELGRPVAIILDENRNRGLLGWLEKEKTGTPLYKGEGLVLWLIRPSV